MIKIIEAEELDMRIEIFSGNITIEDQMSLSYDYVDRPEYKKVRYTFVDFRDAKLNITATQIKEYCQLQLEHPKYQRSPVLVFLDKDPINTAITMLYNSYFGDADEAKIFYTFDAAVKYLGMTDRIQELKKYIKDDVAFENSKRKPVRMVDAS